jgi:hypothetical protein
MKLSSIFAVLFAMVVVGTAHAVPRRAVSLRVLQSTLKAGDSKQAAQLCGITKVSGFLVDKNTHDIVLFGDVNPDLPPLAFDDFVVALRNTWFLYTQRVGRMRYYAAPGCSIDPNPQVLRQMRDVSDRLNTTRDMEARDVILGDWREVGKQPQKVRVMGVPFDSRFAKVMVDADFYMKRLANGTVSLDIDGFNSMADMSEASARQEIQQGTPIPTGQTLNRFWFCPGDTTFTDDGGVVKLTSCPVKLLTEQQYLTISGVKGYGRPDAMALQFAQGFTTKYDDVAKVRPIYRELAGLFRFAGIARLLKDENAPGQAGFDMRYLLSQYAVKVVPVNRAVKGLTNVREIDETRNTSSGSYHSYVTLMSFGGVSMDVHPRRISSGRKTHLEPAHPTTVTRRPENLPPAPSHTSRPTVSVSAPTTHNHPAVSQPSHRVARTHSEPTATKKAVLSARKSSNSLYWDLPPGE